MIVPVKFFNAEGHHQAGWLDLNGVESIRLMSREVGVKPEVSEVLAACCGMPSGQIEIVLYDGEFKAAWDEHVEKSRRVKQVYEFPRRVYP